MDYEEGIYGDSSYYEDKFQKGEQLLYTINKDYGKKNVETDQLNKILSQKQPPVEPTPPPPRQPMYRPHINCSCSDPNMFRINKIDVILIFLCIVVVVTFALMLKISTDTTRPNKDYDSD